MIIFFAHTLVLLAMGFMLWKNESKVFKKLFWPALMLKLLAGIGLGLVYTYYYSVGDTFSYFHDGVVLADFAREDFQCYLRFLWNGDDSFDIWAKLYLSEPRALFLSKITSVVSLISLDNYWIIASYFSFISFCCAWFLVKEIGKFYTAAKIPAAIAFLFYPSIVFWTSGLIKESLAMAGIYFLSIIIIKVWHHSRVLKWQWFIVALAIWMVWGLKYYYFAVFMCIAFTALVIRLIIEPHVKLKTFGAMVFVWLLVFLLPVVVVSFIHPNFYPERFLTVIVSNYEAFASISDPTEMIHYNHLEPTVSSIVRHSPKALLSGIFRPFIWEANTAFQLIVAIENAFMIVFFVVAIMRLKTTFQSSEKILWLSVLMYIILLGVFLSLSTPNFGTLSRYRVGFLPFFILLITCNNPIVLKLSKTKNE